MHRETRLQAGILLVSLPTVVYGGTAIMEMLINDPAYTANPLRQALWRAGHGHAGMLLTLALVALLYVDGANLSERWKQFVRVSVPLSVLFFPLAFFLSVLSPTATKPNGMIYFAYVGSTLLFSGLLVLGIGYLRGLNKSAASGSSSLSGVGDGTAGGGE
jgi:hypothetical protein